LTQSGFEKYVIDWNYFDISKSKKNKIIQISDLHFDELRYSTKLLRKINSIQPDLVFYNWKFSLIKLEKTRIAE
jgi:predicted MPP superfamily phosphohydrolase